MKTEDFFLSRCYTDIVRELQGTGRPSPAALCITAFLLSVDSLPQRLLLNFSLRQVRVKSKNGYLVLGNDFKKNEMF